MTAEELETVFELLLSAGTFETECSWQNEKNDMFAFYNGEETTHTFVVETDASCVRIVYGKAVGSVSEGKLRAEISPGMLAVFIPENGSGRGVKKDGILYRGPEEGGVICCEADAVAAQYSTYSGKPELIRLYRNGDRVQNETGEIRFFRWENMQPK